MRRVRLAFLWHMHQPHYEDPASGEFALPWVRLHAAKDYVDMVERVAEHPGMKATFNFVPSLLEQIEAYNAGHTDAFQRMAAQPAEDLNDAARRFYLRHFLAVHPAVGPGRWPRYRELSERRPRDWHELPESELARLYAPQDLRDLAVLFHLAWLDERHWEPHGLVDVARRGSRFTEDEKAAVLAAHLDVLARVVPAARAAREAGHVELSCSPFYHPILPLLIDPRSAWESVPDLPLPGQRWHFPEDARRQVRDALEFSAARFGGRPSGMWPSEGSVSHETARLLIEEGVAWAASDEGVLARSLGLPHGPERRVHQDLYQPFRVVHEGRSLHLFFRDQELSDRIGFAYHAMRVEDAVGEFLGRLAAIGERWKGPHDPVVTVALDGENCWESYAADGAPFLDALYAALAREPWVEPVTFSELLAEFHDAPALDHLAAGSWIQQDFRVWIGHPEDNDAWDRLNEAREALHSAEMGGGVADEARAEAWRHMGAAEGSDWFWWYGDEHYTPDADIFDRLFRARLQAVWRALGKPEPLQLLEPIKRPGVHTQAYSAPLGLITPSLDGILTHFYEWREAGSVRPGAHGGAMHAGSDFLRELLFGFDDQQLYVRIDWDGSPQELATRGLDAALEIWDSQRVRLGLPGIASGSDGPLEMARWDEGRWTVTGSAGRCVTRTVTEIGIPFRELQLEPGADFQMVLRVTLPGSPARVVPEGEPIRLTVPDQDFEGTIWSV